MNRSVARRVAGPGIAAAALSVLVAGCGNPKKSASPADAASIEEVDAVSGGGTGGAPGTTGVAGMGVGPDAALDLVATALCPIAPTSRPPETPAWEALADLTNQQGWYATSAAAYVVENVLFYQNENGGWPKNIDMSFRFGVDQDAAPKDEKSMIDNDATTTQVRLLAHAMGSWPTCDRYQASFDAGLNFLFDAQYPTNGGWPQVWPVEPTGYSRHITYNDNAMVHVMEIMRDIAYGAPVFKFLSAETRAKATSALSRGIDCMLKTQITTASGVKTGWCAQHDAVTLLPAAARAYELPSQSGKEGAQVLAFLLTVDLSRADVPRQEIIDAVEGAVRFYESVKITGLRYTRGTGDAGVPDSWIEPAPQAPTLWARFYDLEPPHQPFFSDRDGVKVYTLAEVGLERRGGYSWYVSDPRSVLTSVYPAWVARWKLGR